MMSRPCSTLSLHADAPLCVFALHLIALTPLITFSVLKPNEPVSTKTYKLAYAPIKDSDQTAH